MSAKHGSFVFLIILLPLTYWCYSPGLNGPFLLDDYTNLNRINYLNGTLRGFLLAVFGNEVDFLGRPVAYLSFLINAEGWPENPYGFKLVNLILHIVNLVLAYFVILSSKLTDRATLNRVAMLTVCLWALAPINVSTVLYVVQRMTLLAATFTLASLLLYINYRRTQKFAWLFLSGLAAALAFLSKQNGLLILPAIVLLNRHLNARGSVFLRNNHVVEKLLYIGALVYIGIFVFYIWRYLPYFNGRPFTVLERLGAQGVILFDYIKLSLIPDVNHMSLHHDDYETNIAARAVSGAGLWAIHIGTITCAVIYRRKSPIAAMGVLWFYLFHSMESTLLPLELMFEHRNYLPSVGVFLVFSYYIVALASRASKTIDNLYYILGGAAVIVSVFFLYIRVGDWSDSYRMTLKWAEYQKDSPRAQYSYAVELERAGFNEAALEEIVKTEERFKRLGFAFHAWRSQCELGKDYRVLFPPLEKVKNYNFSSEVIYEFKLLSNLWAEGQCIPNGITNNQLDEYITSLTNMKLLDWKPGYKASLHEQIGKFYATTGRIDKASEHFLLLYEVQPTVDTALRNADHAYMYGLEAYARDFIEKAEDIDSRFPVRLVSRKGDIDRLKGALYNSKALPQKIDSNSDD